MNNEEFDKLFFVLEQYKYMGASPFHMWVAYRQFLAKWEELEAEYSFLIEA